MIRNKKTFISLVIIVIISGILFSIYVMSKISSIKELRMAIEKVQQSRETTAEAATGVQKTLELMFPEKPRNDEFIEEILKEAVRYNIADLKIEQKDRILYGQSSVKPSRSTTAKPQKQKVISVYPVKLSFHATYRNAAEFIRELQNQTRLVTMADLSMKRGKGTLTVETTLNIYEMEEL